jgi:membrane protein implicated in regulation of membrane protease activity
MTDVLHLIGGVGAVLIVPWFLFLAGFSVAMPFMLISVVKNVARARRALERIADANDSGDRPSGGGVLRI